MKKIFIIGILSVLIVTGIFLLSNGAGAHDANISDGPVNGIEPSSREERSVDVVNEESNLTNAYFLYLSAFRNAFLGDGGSLIQEVQYFEEYDGEPSSVTMYTTEYSWNTDSGGNTEILTVLQSGEVGDKKGPGMGFTYPFFFLQSSVKSVSIEDSGNHSKLIFFLDPWNMELSDKYLFYNPVKEPGGDPDSVTVEATIDESGDFLELTYFYTFTTPPPDYYCDEIFIGGKVRTYNITKGITE